MAQLNWHNSPLCWTEIDRVETGTGPGPYVITERAPVPGGYLVRMIGYTWCGLPSLGVSITFVPDLPDFNGGAA